MSGQVLLTKSELKKFNTGHCPDCGGKLRRGPSGGCSVNYLCDGRGESRFNMLWVDVERIGAQRCRR